MGFFDFFRKKNPRDKLLNELRANKQLKQQVEDAILLFSGLENRLLGFFTELEACAEARRGIALRKVIERHGFMMEWENRGLVIDLHETDAVIKSRSSKWREIKGNADEMLDLFTRLEHIIKTGQGRIDETKAISEALRQKFAKFCEAASENINQLWQDLQTYPELIGKKALNQKFEILRQELYSDYGTINKIIEAIIVAERRD